MATHEIGHLIHLDPAQAKGRILAALRAEGMHRARAAARLGATRPGTLIDWIRKLGIEAEVERMHAEAVRDGWYAGIKTGRPRGSADKAPRVRRTKVELERAARRRLPARAGKTTGG